MNKWYSNVAVLLLVYVELHYEGKLILSVIVMVFVNFRIENEFLLLVHKQQCLSVIKHPWN